MYTLAMARWRVEASDLLLWEVVQMTGPRGLSAASSVKVIQLWTEAHIAQGEIYPGPGPQMTFVLCPWKQTVNGGL